MKPKSIFIAIIFIMTSCRAQSTSPTSTAIVLPTRTPQPATTATFAPAKILTSIPTPSDTFGAIPLNSVQAFSIEPVAQAIFEQTLDGYVDTSAIQAYRVDRISVFPSGSGGLIAEIMYSLRAEVDPWPDDFGTLGADGWVTGKCSRFDLVATETEHQLKNKRLCS